MRATKILVALAAIGFAVVPVFSADRDDAPRIEMVTGWSIYNDTSPPLREIAIEALPTPAFDQAEIPIQIRPGTEERQAPESVPDPLRQTEFRPFPQAVPTPAPSQSFQGLSDDDNAAVVGVRIVPPDTNGDVGMDYYVQYINLIWAVWDKDTGSMVAGPFAGNSFWVGFGGFCQANNNGDPIVLYDDAADRWFFSQFSPNQGIQCFAVSTTSDPLGPYNRYAFTVTPGGFNDYPKFGVWNDGTTGSTGQSAYTATFRDFGFSTFIGMAAFERDAMLAGSAAQFVKFGFPCTFADCLEGTLPPHLNGPAVPANTCPTFFTAYDDAYDDGPFTGDGVRNHTLCVDWANITSSTIVENTFIAGAPFDRFLGNGFSDCITPVLGGEALDCLAAFSMYPANTRNMGTHLATTFNTTVDVGGDVGGIRWWELRDSGSGWTNYQEGTYSPDGSDRWMGSIAMNANGDIALGYSASSASMFPSVKYTTRQAGDSLGTMPGGEATCHNGTGAQISSRNRWGDYSAMSVDPEDDCTFWYTQEYYETTGSFDFKTRICEFSFSDCGAGAAPIACVNFTNFCDAIQIDSRYSDNTLVARWIATPCGLSDAPMMGAHLPTNMILNFEGDFFATQDVYGYQLDRNTMTFDLWFHDTSFIATQTLDDEPFTISLGACPTSATGSMPASVGNR